MIEARRPMIWPRQSITTSFSNISTPMVNTVAQTMHIGQLFRPGTTSQQQPTGSLVTQKSGQGNRVIQAFDNHSITMHVQ